MQLTGKGWEGHCLALGLLLGDSTCPSLKEAVLTHGTHLVGARKGVKGHGGEEGSGRLITSGLLHRLATPFSNKDDPHAHAMGVLGLRRENMGKVLSLTPDSCAP